MGNCKMQIAKCKMAICTSSLSSFPGSAWERAAGEALPRGSMYREQAGGGTSQAVRFQAEVGNEKKYKLPICIFHFAICNFPFAICFPAGKMSVSPRDGTVRCVGG